MRVIDFFCGAGGFSEGFRQAGFNVIWAVDNWEPAYITHKANHPDTETILGDVEKLSILPDDTFHQTIPDSEIIVGSPPCVDFSNSNKSGKGDKSKGIRLIEAYLRIIARKMFKQNSILQYWLLENIPKAEPYIKDSYTAAELDLPGDFVLQVKNESSHVYNAKYFGVPSNRLRYICGSFPEPQPTIKKDENLIPLQHVLNHLKSPLRNSSDENLDLTISDPNYEGLKLQARNVSDHHYIHELAEHQWKKAKRLKEDKGYMGKMAFPEDVSRPARTVMATMTFGARESMILGWDNGQYRAPTIREVASLMSFPIDYKFYGESIGLKYKLVGNAVPPKISYALAKAIACKLELRIPENHLPVLQRKGIKFYDLNFENIPVQKDKPKPAKARYKYHIPYFIRKTFRVELTNHHSNFDELNFKWDVEIHKSQGPQARKFTPHLCEEIFTLEELSAMTDFQNKIADKLVGFNKFQEIYRMTNEERLKQTLIGPDELLEKVRDLIVSLERCLDFSNSIEITEEKSAKTYSLPRQIGISYFLLTSIVGQMRELQNAKGTEN